MTVDQSAVQPQIPAVPPGMRLARPQDFLVELKTLPSWVRPEVIYWYAQWRMIRDAIAGERQIKDLNTYYLPALDGMGDSEYRAFAHRATYYNFTNRTVSAMSGSIFRRQPLIEGVPKSEQEALKTVAKDKTDFTTFASGTCEEVVKLGRYGVLLDLPAVDTTNPEPYLVGYTAENILDWDEGEDAQGRTSPVRIVLRETNDGRNIATDARKSYVRYRELVLLQDPSTGKLVYQQFVYAAINADAQLSPQFRSDPIIPLRRGEPLDFIPFQIFGAHLSSMSVEKPPMEDIAQLNMSHYRSYAYLEHGRFFCGFPIYYAEEPTGGGTSEYRIGSSTVWVVPSGGKAGVIELNGQGLKFLENALAQKEAQATSLGGKLMSGASATAKGNDQLQLEERNEQSVLLKITRQLDKGFTQILQWWLWWRGMADSHVNAAEVTFNKDFLLNAGGAREFRAIQQMYLAGVIPIDVVYYYLKKNDVIPDWMLQDEFEELIKKTSSFPLQPDAEARDEGFPDMKAKLAHEIAERGLDIQQEEVDLQEQAAKQAADLAATNAKLAAIAASKGIPPKGTPAAPGAPQVPPVAKPYNPVPIVKPSGKVKAAK